MSQPPTHGHGRSGTGARYSMTTPDGTRIRAEVLGSGPRLLLLPGLAADHTTWGPYLDRLAESFHVIAIDHRGTGSSDDTTSARMSTRSLAEDAAQLITSFAGTYPVHVYGHSMGARVAQFLAIDHPELVATLTLGAGTGGDRLGIPRPAAATAAITEGGTEALAALAFGSAGPPSSDARAALGTRERSAEALRNHARASTAHDAWDRLDSISAPTLVLHGSSDRITPFENAIRLSAAIPQATMHRLPESGHMYFLEEADGHEEFLAHTGDRRAGHPVPAPSAEAPEP